MKCLTQVLILAVFLVLITGCSFRLEAEIRPLDLQQTSSSDRDRPFDSPSQQRPT